MSEIRPPVTLDALAIDPTLARRLNPSAASALRRKAVVVLAALTDAEDQPPELPRNGPEPLLDARAAAAILAVPVTWLRETARQGKVRCVHLGHYVRFRRQDLAAFIEADRTPEG
jgi:hypothetical protein